jgi:hypothetical protein
MCYSRATRWRSESIIRGLKVEDLEEATERSRPQSVAGGPEELTKQRLAQSRLHVMAADWHIPKVIMQCNSPDYPLTMYSTFGVGG